MSPMASKNNKTFFFALISMQSIALHRSSSKMVKILISEQHFKAENICKRKMLIENIWGRDFIGQLCNIKNHRKLDEKWEKCKPIVLHLEYY